MSRQTAQWLNTRTLIGDTDKRGTAWHYRADLQLDGQSNHFPGAIPVQVVADRLFNWEALSVPVSITVPATIETMTALDADRLPVRVVTVADRQAIIHPETLETFGVFKSGYQIHQYRPWLLGQLSNLLSDTLHISSAGLLDGGARAWVEVSVPETVTTPEGVTFRPNLLAGTSLDGSLATTFKRTITNTVCDNTMNYALGEDGEQIKIRHSRHSVLKLADAQQALNLVQETGEAFARQVAELTRTEVTNKQWAAFLAEHTAVKPDAKARAISNAEAHRAELSRLYTHDARVSPWAGTAWGVVQAVNTYAHHSQAVRGDRGERNMDKALTGEFDKLDAATFAALGKVLATA